MKPPRTNPGNDRLKRDYLIHLSAARKRSSATVDQVRHAIDRFEAHTGFKDFKTFDKDQALTFRRALSTTKAARSGKPISLATTHHIVRSVQDFLVWLRERPGFRRRIQLDHIEYLNLTRGEERAAHAARPKQYASLEQYRAVILAMPDETVTERRDQALLALLLLTGMRDAAVISLKLKHISVERRHVFQDPREVRTKNRKAIEAYYFPVGEEIEAIVAAWVRHLSTDLLFGPNDPLFPKTEVAPDSNRSFAVLGLSREHWATTAPVRAIFKSAFERIGLSYVKPHSIRDTLTQQIYARQLNVEQLRVWSMNYGHESVMTTLGSYGQIATERRAEVMDELRRPNANKQPSDLQETIAAVVEATITRLSR